MEQTNIKLTGSEIDFIKQRCIEKLGRINTTLRTVGSDQIHSIDEIAVMYLITVEVTGTQEILPLFSASVGTDRDISNDDLTKVQISLLFEQHEDYSKAKEVKMYEVKGQPGELFDFVIPVIYKGIELFFFGNYLGGTMEDLQTNPYWGRAKASCIGLAVETCDLIIDLQEKGLLTRGIRQLSNPLTAGLFI